MKPNEEEYQGFIRGKLKHVVLSNKGPGITALCLLFLLLASISIFRGEGPDNQPVNNTLDDILPQSDDYQFESKIQDGNTVSNQNENGEQSEKIYCLPKICSSPIHFIKPASLANFENPPYIALASYPGSGKF